MEKQQIVIAKKLAGIEVEISSIRLDFIKPIIDFGAPFTLQNNTTDKEEFSYFDPWEKTGDLNLLWKLIDLQALHIEQDEYSFRLVFDENIILECLNQGNSPELVLTWGGAREGGGIILDRYLADL